MLLILLTVSFCNYRQNMFFIETFCKFWGQEIWRCTCNFQDHTQSFFGGVLIFEMVIFPCRFHGCLQVRKCFEKSCLQTSNCLKAYSEGEIFNITSIYYIHSNRNFMIYKKNPIVVKMERSIVANLLLASIMLAQWKLLNYVQ